MDKYPDIKFTLVKADMCNIMDDNNITFGNKESFKIWRKYKDRITKESFKYLIQSAVQNHPDLETL